DMDKLDYLPRDARACNVPYGGVDTARLIGSLTPLTVPGTGERRIGIEGKGISPLHSLINARQEMFDNVYWHHTNRACMAMLLRAVQDALIAGVISADSLTGHDDASLLAFMQGDSMPEGTRKLADALAERRIHKRALEISARADILYPRLGQLWYDPAARREDAARARGPARGRGERQCGAAASVSLARPARCPRSSPPRPVPSRRGGADAGLGRWSGSVPRAVSGLALLPGTVECRADGR